MRRPRRITAWSYSRWTTYDTCAGKAKFKFIDKLPDPAGPAAERGLEIHNTAERFVTQHLNHGFCEFDLESPLDTWKDDFDDLIETLRSSSESFVEEQWAFTDEWEETGWFDNDAWCRVKMDVAWRKGGHGVFVDYKTGKMRDEHDEQADLYAVAMLVRFPNLRTVRGEFWYVDQDSIQPYEYDAAEIERLKEEWNRRGTVITTAEEFPFNPGRHCRWCAYARDQGGPCQNG